MRGQNSKQAGSQTQTQLYTVPENLKYRYPNPQYMLFTEALHSVWNLYFQKVICTCLYSVLVLNQFQEREA